MIEYMKKIGRNDMCPCGSGKKYKKCCLDKDRKAGEPKQRVIEITRRDFISKPYKKCPNPQCLSKNSFGVSFCISGSKTYTRECIKCGYKENFNLPEIKKKILYLDQFVISNLIKLLDKSHPSHEKIKAEPFWKELFIKLEAASKSQAIVCPDSFYHIDESLVGNIEFRLMKRLYEHFSSGKTLYPGVRIEQNQISQHFEGWLEKKKVKFSFRPEDIAFEGNLHTWSVGMRVSVNLNPYSGQLEKLQRVNAKTEGDLSEIWTRWQMERGIGFVKRVKEEVMGLGKGLIDVAKQFSERQKIAMAKIIQDQNYNFDLDDLLPPLSNDIFKSLTRIALAKGIPEVQIAETIGRYFNDVDSLLEIPKVKIGSVMYAGLSNMAANGKKHPPKSTVDVQFISSYLPYCDALFVDKESAYLLREFPKNTPDYLRLKEFPAKVFSLSNKEEFLEYLDQLIAEIPSEQIAVLKDIGGEDYTKPYWGIIEHEKQELGNPA